MKKHLPNSLRALFLSLAVLLSLPMLAVEIDGINYELVAKIKEATVIGCSYSGEVVIPESVEHEGTTYSVTSIGDEAFGGCSGLTSVTIGNSVTSIGEMAFYGCSGLTSVTIGNSVTSIGEEAFYYCSGLTSVTIPNSVTSIGEEAFRECSGLTSVTIPNSVKSIGNQAFLDCTSLTSVHISDIAAWCNIIFEQEGGYVGTQNPLYYAHHLYLNGEEVKDLVIPNSVTSIGSYAFSGFSGLTSVTIGNSVTSIGERAFIGCYGLTSVTIGNSVTSIGEEAFYNCSGLTSVTIGNSVTSIGEDAFSGCHFVTENFVNNSSLSAEENKYWGAGLHDYETEDGLLIDSTNVAFCRKSANIVIIPNSVTSIGDQAFYFCSGLTSVTIPNSVTSIGDFAFYFCEGLTSVSIGNSVTSIGNGAFAYCSELLDFYCYAEKVPSTYNDAFEGSYPEYATLHVPDGSIESYKAKTPWSGFGKIVALTEEETGIDELKGENGKVKTAVYDLSGRRVQKAQKGIFIQNGKVVVK